MIGISLQNTAKVLLILFSLALFPIFATANVLVSEQYSIMPKGNGVGEGTVFSSSNYIIQGGAQTVSGGGDDDTEAEDSGGRSGSGRNRVTRVPNQNIFPEFIVGLKNEPLPSQRKNTLSVREQEAANHEQSESIETTDSLQEVNTRSADARDMRFTASAMGGMDEWTAY